MPAPQHRPIEWAWLKACLLFIGLIGKSLAFGEPLPFWWGHAAQAVAGIVWPAFDGAFLWLLRGPTDPRQKSSLLEQHPAKEDNP